MAWGEKGREMDSVSPRYASQSGRTNRNDGMDGFDRWMRIFFLISIPVVGVIFYFGWKNGWL